MGNDGNQMSWKKHQKEMEWYRRQREEAQNNAVFPPEDYSTASMVLLEIRRDRYKDQEAAIEIERRLR